MAGGDDTTRPRCRYATLTKLYNGTSMANSVKALEKFVDTDSGDIHIYVLEITKYIHK
jgi:hypothetical protein